MCCVLCVDVRPSQIMLRCVGLCHCWCRLTLSDRACWEPLSLLVPLDLEPDPARLQRLILIHHEPLSNFAPNGSTCQRPYSEDSHRLPGDEILCLGKKKSGGDGFMYLSTATFGELKLYLLKKSGVNKVGWCKFDPGLTLLGCNQSQRLNLK